MTEENKIKVVIAPSALADLEETMSPEELQQFLAEFQALVESGDIFSQSEPINMDTLEQDDPELFAQMRDRMTADGFTDFDEWMDAQYQPPTLN
jgi:hypothetical protein